MISRRSVLAATALPPLGGCAYLKNLFGNTPAQWAQDLSLVASEMPALVSAVQGLGAVPQATLNQISSYAAIVQKDAAAVASATATVVAGTNLASTVEEAAQTLKAIGDVVMPLFPASAPFVPVLDAIMSLVPEFLAAAGVAGASAVVPKYRPEQARLILRAHG
jgi:hypothetical protein